MIITLNSTFSAAYMKRQGWTHDSTQEALAAVASLADHLHIDWDIGCEEWVRVLSDNSVIAYVCAKMPLVLIHSSLAGIASKCDVLNNTELIAIDTFIDRTFSVDRSLLEKVFERRVSDNLSYETLSIEDLWWATV